MSVMQIDIKDSDIADNQPKDKEIEKESNVKKIEPKTVFKKVPDPNSNTINVVATSNTSGNKAGVTNLFGADKKIK